MFHSGECLKYGHSPGRTCSSVDFEIPHSGIMKVSVKHQNYFVTNPILFSYIGQEASKKRKETPMHKDETDIRLLLKTHGDAIYRSAYLLLGNPHDVQDVLQEVLLRFLEKAPTFATTDHERAWLLRVTTNCCIDCLRFRKKHSYTDLDLLKECLPTPQQQTHLEELYALPAKWKSVLILYYFEGYSVAETAKILRLSENAVKKRLQRAREALKIALSEPEENRKAQNRKSMKTLNQTEFY